MRYRLLLIAHEEMELLNSLGKLSCLAIERAAITNMRKPQPREKP